MSDKQVEMGPIDPSDLIAPAPKPTGPKDLQPITSPMGAPVPPQPSSNVPNYRSPDLDTSQYPDHPMFAAAAAHGTPVQPSQAPAPAAPSQDPLDRVKLGNNLVKNLFEKFGNAEVKHTEAVLKQSGGDQTVTVKFRRERYEDQIWAMGVVAGWSEDPNKISLIQTDQQVRMIIEHLSCIATLVEIEGVPTWEFVGLAEQYPPGTQEKDVPLAVLAMVREAVYEVLQALDPDLIWQLVNAVNDAKNPAPKTESGGKGNEETPEPNSGDSSTTGESES